MADHSRGYDLASLTDLEWLWAQRQKSDSLRKELLSSAIERSDSPAIHWNSVEDLDRWHFLPLLTVAILPGYPTEFNFLELDSLLKIVNSLLQVQSPWKSVICRVPWKLGYWRSIPGAVCISEHGNKPHLHYLEIGNFLHFYSAYSIEIREENYKFIPAFSILAYIHSSLRFFAQFLNIVDYSWPLTVNVTLQRSNTAKLLYKLPAARDPFEGDYLSLECPDDKIDLLSLEIPALEIYKQLDSLMIKSTKALFWAYGLGWDDNQILEWYKKLST